MTPSTAAAAGDGNDNLKGGDGADQLYGHGGDDIIVGGAGIDTLTYADAGASMRIDLATSEAGEGNIAGFTAGAPLDQISNVEAIIGSAYNDIILSIAGASIDGAAGNDILRGGTGDDLLRGGNGADRLEGGSGSDTASYVEQTGGLTIDLVAGTSSEGDQLVDIENVIGGQSSDTITGDASANRLNGHYGNDTLVGGAGDDVLIGNANRDIMTGGDGADRFVFQSLSDSSIGGATRDRIMDLDIAAGDRIDFSTLDIDPSTTAREALTYIGTGAYSGTAGEVRIATSANAGYTAVAIDSDGDGTSNFIIEVAIPLADLTADAFLL